MALGWQCGSISPKDVGGVVLGTLALRHNRKRGIVEMAGETEEVLRSSHGLGSRPKYQYCPRLESTLGGRGPAGCCPSSLQRRNIVRWRGPSWLLVTSLDRIVLRLQSAGCNLDREDDTHHRTQPRAQMTRNCSNIRNRREPRPLQLPCRSMQSLFQSRLAHDPAASV